MSGIVGFTSHDYLMIDSDNHTKERVTRWTKVYGNHWNLGCGLIMLSSNRGSVRYRKNYIELTSTIV
ncbi:hypothetical protein MUP79_04565 [Candidatus Bathyarchaeota archaeon]|jgi:hypothetical protein|nr:hypothetical protein [Candidatus Bathyarchaeota archaeon]